METKLIQKHLENWNGLKRGSIEHFAKSGKVSGNLFIAIKEMMNEYADLKTKKLQEENKEWERSFDLYHSALMRGEKLFREINPDFPILSSPDTGKMIESLCEEITKLKAK